MSQIAGCDTCKFYEPEEEQCRRNAPLPSDSGHVAIWPHVSEDDWCGEYTRRPANPVFGT